jgi:hypothetical protein
LNERSISCGETASSAWARSRSAPDSRTKAISPVTSSASSASRRDSFGFPQESPKSPQAHSRYHAVGKLVYSPRSMQVNLIAQLSTKGVCQFYVSIQPVRFCLFSVHVSIVDSSMRRIKPRSPSKRQWIGYIHGSTGKV